jgi:hypothetical protein
MGGRLEEMAKLDDTVNVEMEPEEALRLLLGAESEKDEDAENEGESVTPPTSLES